MSRFRKVVKSRFAFTELFNDAIYHLANIEISQVKKNQNRLFGMASMRAGFTQLQ